MLETSFTSPPRTVLCINEFNADDVDAIQRACTLESKSARHSKFICLCLGQMPMKTDSHFMN